MRPRLAILAATVTLGLAAGCASSSSTSGHAPPTAKTTTKPATVTGTERFSGTVTGHAVVADNAPAYHLTFTGPVNTTGTFTPPSSNAMHQAATFRTGAGNLAVNATVYGQGAQPKPLGNCRYSIPITAMYVVDGAKSTGKFKGASGHGTANVDTRFRVRKLANGACDLNQAHAPLDQGAVSAFTGSGPLTVKQ